VNSKLKAAVAIGLSPASIAQVRADARKALPQFPKDGCATYLSCLLRRAELPGLPVIVGAEELADHLRYNRGWARVSLGNEKEGDVAVTVDLNHNGRADHIFLVLRVQDRGTGLLLITDNQSESAHSRYESGRGKTPVNYYLRAPEDKPEGPTVLLQGKAVDPADVIFKDGRNYVALDALDGNGAHVSWDPATKTASIQIP
jgi:hypothetical protein